MFQAIFSQNPQKMKQKTYNGGAKMKQVSASGS